MRHECATYAPCVPVLSRRIDSSPNSGYLILRAKILARVGRWNEAADDLDRAAALTSDDAAKMTWFTTHWQGLGPLAAELDAELPAEVVP